MQGAECNRSLAGLRPPETTLISDDHLGCLILVGIKPRYNLAGTLSFQASSSSLHTCIKYYFVCTQRGLLLSAPSAVALMGSLCWYSKSRNCLRLFFFSRSFLASSTNGLAFLRLGSSWACGGKFADLTFSCSLKLSNNVRLDACSDRNAESASTNSNSMPCPTYRLIYDAEMLLSSEPETSCFKASQSFSRSNISTPIRIGEVLQQNPYLSRLVLLDLLRY